MLNKTDESILTAIVCNAVYDLCARIRFRNMSSGDELVDAREEIWSFIQELTMKELRKLRKEKNAYKEDRGDSTH